MKDQLTVTLRLELLMWAIINRNETSHFTTLSSTKSVESELKNVCFQNIDSEVGTVHIKADILRGTGMRSLCRLPWESTLMNAVKIPINTS